MASTPSMSLNDTARAFQQTLEEYRRTVKTITELEDRVADSTHRLSSLRSQQDKLEKTLTEMLHKSGVAFELAEHKHALLAFISELTGHYGNR